MSANSSRRLALLCLTLAAYLAAGCVTAPLSPPPPDPTAPPVPTSLTGIQQAGFKHKNPISLYHDPLPRELEMVTMPEYVIEPPDFLRIDAIRILPPSPYKVEPLDGLFIQVANLPMEEPISGIFVVDPNGTITLGPTYGSLRVVGLTLEQVKPAVEEHLKRLKVLNPKASVSLAQSRALQQIRGEHLVRPDGTVGLGTYGSVRVVGMTLSQAKFAIEQHLSQFVQQPQVSVDVAAYNSKVFFVIYDGSGYGQQILQMPVTGNDTVLKAIAQLNGLPALSSKYRLWIARPAPMEVGRELILPIDWSGITTKGQVRTNYQLLPGDRLYVSGNRLITFNTYLGQVLAPLERMLGFTLLGNTTGRAVAGQNTSGGTTQ